MNRAEDRFAPDELAALEAASVDPAVPLRQTLRNYEVAPSTYYSMRRRLNWRVRSEVGAGRRGGAPRGRRRGITVEQRLEEIVTRRMAALDASMARGGEPDPERTARTLATLARTLKSARDLGSARGGDAEEPVRPLSELRDELLAHLDRIRAEGRPDTASANEPS